MDDLISRQEALNALGEEPLVWNGWWELYKNKQWRKDVEAIKSVPSAQVERKKGVWIYGKDEYGIDGYRCDKCGFFVPRGLNVHKFINYIEDYNYCPSCGADMKERQEEWE